MNTPRIQKAGKINDSMRKQNTHLRISDEILKSAFLLYSDSGWKLLWIARKFNVYHTTLFYHILKKHIPRNIPVLTKKPAEVEAIYRSRLFDPPTKRQLAKAAKTTLYFDDIEDDYSDLVAKTYKQSLADSLKRKDDKPDTECSHAYWMKRCSMCAAILESDAILNQLPCTEPVRYIYHEFDKMVCSHDSALELQQMGVCQSSMLYWIYFDNRNVLTIRVKSNLPTSCDENTAVTSAFTSQELSQLLLRIPVYMRDASFMNKLALNGNNPTYLAKLLIRSLRKFEQEHKSKRKSIQQSVETNIIINENIIQ